MVTMSDEELDAFRRHWGYVEIKMIGHERYAATAQQLFTCAIVVGRLSDEMGYEKRWCYETPLAASAALAIWDGQGEPVGWHRAVHSGERVSRSANEIDEMGRRVGAIGVRYTRY